MARPFGFLRTKSMITFSRPDDPSRDFCLWDYQRPSEVQSASIRQENIIFAIAQELDPSGQTTEILRIIQRIAGHFNTVWGLKTSGVEPSIELYFYDYDQKFLRTNPKTILGAISHMFSVTYFTTGAAPFFMWSMEVNPKRLSHTTEIDLYFSGIGGTISSGECYTVRENYYEFKNIYYFFECDRDTELILEALSSSPRTTNATQLPSYLHPGRAHEKVYVVARKRFNDGVYLSRTPLDKSIEILQHAKFNQSAIDFLEENYTPLNHHLYDIGLDYRIDKNNHFSIIKSAIYGIL